MPQQQPATINFTDPHKLICTGQWTLQNIGGIEQLLNQIPVPSNTEVAIDGGQITKIDSAGAWCIHRLQQRLDDHNNQITLQNFSDHYTKLLDLTGKEKAQITTKEIKEDEHGTLYWIGNAVINQLSQVKTFLSFVGETATMLRKIITQPRFWQWQATLHTIQDHGYYAIPIIGLLSFLVGVVLAYQLGVQLKLYGATPYIVDLTGLAVLREFGPLITAIIIAGRTTSSYTAQLGLMKVNQEVDALYAMGLSPINRLAIPRIIGVVISLPLLTIWADATGIFGSMLMTKFQLDINMRDFIARFDDAMNLPALWTGLGKSPVFGLLVATVGCFQGFQVKYTAESIGYQTTKSVVQAIFLVIIADALFSILFSELNI